MTRRLRAWLDRGLDKANGSLSRRGRRVLYAAVAISMPVAILSSVQAIQEMRRSVSRGFEQHLTDLAVVAAQQVTVELSIFTTAATMLALSPELQPGGVPGDLYRQAWQFGETIGGWVVITSAEPGRSQLLNTHKSGPHEASSPQPGLTIPADAALRTRRSSVSDLSASRPNQEMRVAVSVPVMAGGVPRSVVSILVEPDAFSLLLAAMPLPPGGFMVVTDGNGRTVGRVGTAAEGLSWDFPADAPDGIAMRQAEPSGEQILFAVRHVAAAPTWHVAVALPVQAPNSLVGRHFRWVAMTRFSLLVLGLLGGTLILMRLRETRAAYQELDRVLAHAPAVIGVTRVWPDGHFKREFLSRSAVQLTGWSYAELLEMGNLAALMTEDAVADVRRNLVDALEGMQTTFEFQLRRRDGVARTIRCCLSLVDRTAGGSGTVALCLLDVTEIHVGEQRVRMLEKLAVLGELSSGIAHELNQPLAAIALAAENGARALQRVPPNLGAADAKFVRISEQVHRITSVIDNVRAFSHDDADAAEAIDVSRMLHQVLSILEARLKGSGLTLRIDLPPDLPKVRAFGVRLEQAVLNLIINACDAYRDSKQAMGQTGGQNGGQNGPRIIRVAGRQDGGTLVLTVADNAGGIGPDVLPRIFDPFFTTKTAGKGTGLGLSISLASVLEMGGTMHVHNADGGACFEIALPIDPATRASG